MRYNIGVVGVGKMGSLHLQTLKKIPSIEKIFIYDINPKKVEEALRKFNPEVVSTVEDLVSKINLCIISTPTPTHYQITKFFLNSNIHCFVEKPFTDSIQTACELIEIAEKKNLILQIGHIERFNPAVIEAQKYIHNPKFIEAYRLGPFDPRVAHIGVVIDLMIHDIDVILSFIKKKVKSLEVIGTKILTQHEDIIKVRLRFESECICDLSASRVSPENFRKMRIFQPDSYISIDYIKPSLKIYRKKNPTVKSFDDIEFIHPKLKIKEPLVLELEHFIESVATGKKPIVAGEHGRDALEIALEIVKKLNEKTTQ